MVTVQMWVESVFNVMYLVVIWGLVIVMVRRQAQMPPSARRFAPLFAWAFGLLAFGDTGHLIARVIASLQGNLYWTVEAFGRTLAPLSLGMLATSITMTFFYALLLVIWQRRFEKPYGVFGYVLFAAAAVRLVLLAFPQNGWNSVDPPRDWAIYRNVPLFVSGLGVAYLILRDALAAHDRAFTWIGALILISFGCYTPVVLFADLAPAVGMLMLPKTLAYVAIAVVAYLNWFAAAKQTPVAG